MRLVVLVLAGWTGSTLVAAGLFVAFVRGSGGTDLALTATPRPAVVLPQPRTAVAPRARSRS